MKTKVEKQERKLNWIGCPSESVYLGWLEILDKSSSQSYVMLEWINPPTQYGGRVFLLRKDKDTMYQVVIEESQDNGRVTTCDCPAGKRYKKKQCKHVASIVKLMEKSRI